MISHIDLAAKCVRGIKDYEKSTGLRTPCVAIIYTVHDAPLGGVELGLVLSPLNLDEMLTRRNEKNLKNILDPGAYQYVTTIGDNLFIHRIYFSDNEEENTDDYAALEILLPNLLYKVRENLPDKLIFMSDYECLELEKILKGVPLPPEIAWLSELIDQADPATER